jgi:hypothetical protein
VRVLEDARCLRSSFLGPFMAAGGALPMIRVGQHVGEGAKRAGRSRHARH